MLQWEPDEDIWKHSKSDAKETGMVIKYTPVGSYFAGLLDEYITAYQKSDEDGLIGVKEMKERNRLISLMSDEFYKQKLETDQRDSDVWGAQEPAFEYTWRGLLKDINREADFYRERGG
jgi:hypothetical protein